MGGAKVAVTGIVFINIDQMKLQSSGLVLVKKKLEENIDQCWIWWRWSKVSSKAATQRNLSWCNNEKRTLFANIFTFKMFSAVDRFVFLKPYSCLEVSIKCRANMQMNFAVMSSIVGALRSFVRLSTAYSHTRDSGTKTYAAITRKSVPRIVDRDIRSNCSSL